MRPKKNQRPASRSSGALLALLCLLPGLALGQQSLLQGGSMTAGHLPMYSIGGTGQPIVLDAGPAGGNTTGQGVSELNITARGTGTAPYAAQGTGVDGTIFQIQDAVSTNSTGYHYLAFSANALGGGLMEYGAAGSASALPFTFKVNGTSYSFPFAVGGIVGPATTVANNVACWNNTVGTLLKDCGTQITAGGSPNQVQYNNAGVLGGFTMSGDATVVPATGVITVSKIGGNAISLGGAFTTSGAFATTLTATAATTLTLPTAGTLATLAGTEALTNKTYNGLTVTSSTGTLAITNGKAVSFLNQLGFSGTDGSSLNIGTGGTLGTAAYTAASAYMPAGVQLTNTLAGPVTLNNTAAYFDGPVVAQGSTGTWFASGTVTLISNNQDAYYCKLWDGTTVMASSVTVNIATVPTTLSLSGYISAPVSNIRISCKDATNTTGFITANFTGNSRDSTISVFRVQ
jgi:hypothetical protein